MSTALQADDMYAKVGPIPASWTVKPLSAMFKFSGGYSASREQLSDAGHLYLHYGDIHTSSRTVIDTEIDAGDIPRLDVPIGRVSRVSLLRDGDVVFVDASEDDAGSSKHVLVRNTAGVPFISGLHTIVARSFTDDIASDYRRYCFQSEAIRRQFHFYAVGTKVTGISKTNIAKILVPFPRDHQEQRAIAGALSDADALIAALDRLIAKKRDVKQAAMQELLTGRVRLPGFRDDWDECRLGDVVAKIVGGGTPSRDNPQYWGPDIPWVTVKDFATFHPRQTQESITREGLARSASHLVPKGTLITSTRMALGCAVIYDVDVAINQDLKALFPKPMLAMEFLYYWFEMNAQMIESMGTGSTVMGISLGDLRALSFYLPILKEQRAIATVLTDMDAEVAALKARRDKARLVKEGMMQELLTGRVRLV